MVNKLCNLLLFCLLLGQLRRLYVVYFNRSFCLCFKCQKTDSLTICPVLSANSLVPRDVIYNSSSGHQYIYSNGWRVAVG